MAVIRRQPTSRSVASEVALLAIALAAIARRQNSKPRLRAFAIEGAPLLSLRWRKQPDRGPENFHTVLEILFRFSPTALASIDCRPIKMPSSLTDFLIFHNYFLIYRTGILGPIFQGFFEFRGHDIVVLVVRHVAHVDL